MTPHQYGWDNAPAEVRSTMESVVLRTRDVFGENLVGVYLHGSLAMGCYHPATSDLDFLVVVRRPVTVHEKRAYVEALLDTERNSGISPLFEMSIVLESHLREDWEYPTPFEFHYGADWREKYERERMNGEWLRWNDPPHPHRDPDLAAHATVTYHRGIALAGKPIRDVFRLIPVEHYEASLLSDFAWARERLEENPVYLVLNFCRIYQFLTEKAVVSKDEGGVWGMEHLPPPHSETAHKALLRYRGADPMETAFHPGEVEAFADYVAARVRECSP